MQNLPIVEAHFEAAVWFVLQLWWLENKKRQNKKYTTGRNWSLCISVVRWAIFYGTEFEIWIGFELATSTEEFLQFYFWGCIFHVFMGICPFHWILRQMTKLLVTNDWILTFFVTFLRFNDFVILFQKNLL